MLRYIQKILCIFLLLPNIVNASSNLDYLDDASIEIYNYHMDHCKDIDVALFAGMDWNVTKTSASEFFSTLTGDRQGIHTFVEHKGRSSMMDNHLQSLGYYLALNDCLLDDESAKNLYTMGFIFSDFSGKVSNLLGIEFAAVALAKISLKLSKVQKISALMATGLVVTGAIISSIYQEVRPRTVEEKKKLKDFRQQKFSKIDNTLRGNLVIFQKMKKKYQEILKNPQSSEEEVKRAKERLLSITEHLQKLRDRLG